jgi:hypothetical protein
MTTTVRALNICRTIGIATAAVLIGSSAFGVTSASAVGPAVTSTSLASSLNPSDVGAPVSFTATVTKTGGTPEGSVAFTDNLVPMGTVTLAGGVAVVTSSTLTAGTHVITATYTPSVADALNSLPSTSLPLTQTVNAAGGGGVGLPGGGLPGGGLPGVCLPGQTTPTPTISAPARVVGPHAVTVHGTAAPNDAVDLYQLDAGGPAFAKVGSAVASATGSYSFSRNISKRATFVVRDTGPCGPANSAKAVTQVALSVSEKLSSPKKARLRLRAVTAPRVANQMAKFYRVKKDGTRTVLAKVATGAKGVAHKTIKARSGKHYRIYCKVSAPAGNLAGTSKRMKVTVR